MSDAADSTPKKGNWQDTFLRIFSESLDVSNAARGAGVDRSTIYKKLKSSPAFAEAFDQARQAAAEHLEAIAYTRAQTISDTLLIFLLKSHKPERYRESFEQHHRGQVEVIVRREQRTGTTKQD